MTVLQVLGISKAFGDVLAVDDLSFELGPGQICGFIGPNGAGKTTAMRICATLEIPDSGDVLVSGRSVLSCPRDARDRLGYMPDDFPMEPSLQVRDFLEFYARSYGLRGAELRSIVAEVAEFTGVDSLLGKECSSLSKGMRQRAALAVTLLHDPSLLILDEPAAGLDPRARVELRTLLQTLAEAGKSVLISSHILAELSEICDHVVVIEKGRLRGAGRVSSIGDGLSGVPNLHIRCQGGVEALLHFLAEQPGVSMLRAAEEGAFLRLEGGDPERSALLAALVGRGFQVCSFAPRHMDLEELFLSMTEGEVQ